MANELNIQVVWDTISNIFLIAFPFSFAMSLIAKATNFFLSFVFGKKEVTL